MGAFDDLISSRGKGAFSDLIPSGNFADLIPASENLSTTLNIAGFDTGVPIGKELSAYLTSFGGKMIGSYRGAKQLLGLDKGEEAENEAALRRLEADPEVGGYAKAGGIIGSGFDPAAYVVPFAKAKTAIDLAKRGFVSGGIVGALNPVNEGDSRVVNAATGAGATAIAAPAIGSIASRLAGNRLPLRAPIEPVSLPPAPVSIPETPALSGQDATKAAIRAFKARNTRALAPDLTNPSETPIQEVLARRRAIFGGVDPRLAIQVGGGGAGAATGALTADENASPGEIASRALLGGVAGWQLAKLGTRKIGGVPATTSPSAIPKTTGDVVVVGDAAEPLMTKQLNPEVEKKITDLAKAYYAGGGQRTMPDKLISDEIKAKIVTGEVPMDMARQYGIEPSEIAGIFRSAVTDHARAMGRLSQVYRQVEKNLTPEERSAIQAAGDALDDAAYVRPFWKKLTDTWRGLLVTQPATAVRNAITQVGRIGLDVIQAPIEHWTQRMTGRPVTAQPLDGFQEVLQLFRKNKASTDQIFQSFPDEKARLFNRFLSDVEIASNVSRDGRVWGAIDTGVAAANILNRTQEFIIRRAIFQSSLAVQMRNRGADLAEIIKTNQTGAIPEDAIKAAVDTALTKTWAATPAWGTISRKMIDAINALPGANIAIPFPRFMYNAIKFQYEYSPMGILSYLSDAERKAFAAGDVSRISKAVVGTGLLGAAMLFRNSENAGEKWYEARTDDGNTVDLRPFNPFASYLFVADLIKKSKDGTLYKLTGSDIAQGLLSSNMRAGTGLYLLDNAINLMSKTADEKKLGTKLAEFGGDFLGGFLTPLAAFRDAYDQITDGQSIARDTRAEPLVGPLKSRIPGVSQTLPEAEVPTREGPRVTVNPLLRQATGLTVSGPKNALEKELDRLGFDRREVLPASGDHELDQKYAKIMGVISTRVLVPIVDGEKFKAMGDTLKGVVLHELLSEVRNEVRSVVNESLPADKQLSLEIKKQDPRMRLLLKELAPQLFER